MLRADRSRLDLVKRYPAAAEIRRQQDVPFHITLDREAMSPPRRAQPAATAAFRGVGERIELVTPVEFLPQPLMRRLGPRSDAMKQRSQGRRLCVQDQGLVCACPWPTVSAVEPSSGVEAAPGCGREQRSVSRGFSCRMSRLSRLLAKNPGCFLQDLIQGCGQWIAGAESDVVEKVASGTDERHRVESWNRQGVRLNRISRHIFQVLDSIWIARTPSVKIGLM